MAQIIQIRDCRLGLLAVELDDPRQRLDPGKGAVECDGANAIGQRLLAQAGEPSGKILIGGARGSDGHGAGEKQQGEGQMASEHGTLFSNSVSKRSAAVAANAPRNILPDCGRFG